MVKRSREKYNIIINHLASLSLRETGVTEQLSYSDCDFEEVPGSVAHPRDRLAWTQWIREVAAGRCGDGGSALAYRCTGPGGVTWMRLVCFFSTEK